MHHTLRCTRCPCRHIHAQAHTHTQPFLLRMFPLFPPMCFKSSHSWLHSVALKPSWIVYHPGIWDLYVAYICVSRAQLLKFDSRINILLSWKKKKPFPAAIRLLLHRETWVNPSGKLFGDMCDLVPGLSLLWGIIGGDFKNVFASRC